MSRTNTAAYESIKASQIVFQNPDRTFPEPGAVLAIDNLRGATTWTRNLDVNSMTLSGSSSTGVLTYDNQLLVNGNPVSSNGLTSGYNITVAGGAVNMDIQHDVSMNRNSIQDCSSITIVAPYGTPGTFRSIGTDILLNKPLMVASSPYGRLILKGTGVKQASLTYAEGTDILTAISPAYEFKTSAGGDNIIAIDASSQLYVDVSAGSFADVLGYDVATGAVRYQSKNELTFYSAKHMFPSQTIDISSIDVSAGYCAGILAPNGKIYYIPKVVSKGILVINPELNTVNTIPIPITFFGGSTLWIGAVLGPNGHIFGIPYDSSAIIVIDTAINKVSTISVPFGIAKWAGGVLGTNGKIYCVPFTRTQILVIDPYTNGLQYIASPSINNGWLGGVLGSDGKIYCIPFASSNVLVIDTDTNTFSTIATGVVGSAKWYSGVLGPNGLIYGIPFNATSVLIINPNAGTVDTTSMPIPSPITTAWAGGVLGMNGKIYGIPATETRMLVIDGMSLDVSGISVPVGSNKWIGGVLVAGGSIYGTPNTSSQVLIIRPGLPTLQPWMLAPEFNKL